jgi:hypothetical protein
MEFSMLRHINFMQQVYYKTVYSISYSIMVLFTFDFVWNSIAIH